MKLRTCNNCALIDEGVRVKWAKLRLEFCRHLFNNRFNRLPIFDRPIAVLPRHRDLSVIVFRCFRHLLLA